MTVRELIAALERLAAAGHGELECEYYDGSDWQSPDPQFNPDDEGDFVEL